MNKILLGILVIIGGGILGLGIGIFWGVGVYNSAKTLRNQYDAKVKANEAVFDNTWKKISQTVQVADVQKDALKEIFTSHASARSGTGDGGTLMKWVQESVPNVDQSIYRNLQNIIAGSRDEWTANQVALVDVAREYNLLLEKFPSAPLLAAFGFQKLVPRLVTSARTDAAFASGRDDVVELRAVAK